MKNFSRPNTNNKKIDKNNSKEYPQVKTEMNLIN